MVRARVSRGAWPLVGLAALGVVTAILVSLAVARTWGPPGRAMPVSLATETLTTPVATSPSPSVATSPSPTATARRAGLAGLGDIINSPQGASILVIGDNSGDGDGEWVSTWAHALAQHATVSCNPWNAKTGTYGAAVRLGSGPPTITVWNASAGSPTMTTEPARVGRAWRQADVVLLSYGHGRAATLIGPQLDAVLAAIHGHSATVPVAVLLQNPERAATETAQRDVTQAIKTWATGKGFPTVDLYGAFTASTTPRDQLVQSDGTPTFMGSTLWATTLARALGAPA